MTQQALLNFGRTLDITLQDESIRYSVVSPNNLTDRRYATLFEKEPETIAFINEISADEVFLDIGANIGIYSLYAALARKLRVYSFEPHFENFCVLNRNIVLNKLDKQVTAYCVGVASTQTSLSVLHHLSFAPGMSGNSVDRPLDENLNSFSASFVQGIPVLSIIEIVESIVRENNKLVAIKCDIDGLEHEIFDEWAIRGIFKNVNRILVEVNTNLNEHNWMIKHLERKFKIDLDCLRAIEQKKQRRGYGNLIFRKR